MAVQGSSNRGVAFITGGSRGIGAALARTAAQRGYAVAIVYRDRSADADKVVAGIEKAGGRAIAIRADIADEAAIVDAFRQSDALGPLTLLVNNAGITGPMARVADIDAATVDSVMRINVTAPFVCAREAVRRMSTARGGKGGSIVNISSGASQMGSGGTWVHYAASKGAIDTFTIGLAREVAAEGIRVNGVRAGMIATEIHAARAPELTAKMVAGIPLGRIGQPEEIANTVLWLASDEASFVTGALMDVRGGM